MPISQKMTLTLGVDEIKAIYTLTNTETNVSSNLYGILDKKGNLISGLNLMDEEKWLMTKINNYDTSLLDNIKVTEVNYIKEEKENDYTYDILSVKCTLYPIPEWISEITKDMESEEEITSEPEEVTIKIDRDSQSIVEIAYLDKDTNESQVIQVVRKIDLVINSPNVIDETTLDDLAETEVWWIMGCILSIYPTAAFTEE